MTAEELARPPLEWGDLWAAMRANYDAGLPAWVRTTEEMFMEMLEVVPPRCQTAGAFLVGEPWSTNAANENVHAAFRFDGGGHWARYMTVPEFRAAFKQPAKSE